MKDTANWCERRNALSEREPTALLLFGALSAYGTALRKCVTKPLNMLDEANDTMHYQRGRKPKSEKTSPPPTLTAVLLVLIPPPDPPAHAAGVGLQN